MIANLRYPSNMTRNHATLPFAKAYRVELHFVRSGLGRRKMCMASSLRSKGPPQIPKSIILIHLIFYVLCFT